MEAKGQVTVEVEHIDGRKNSFCFHNAVLRKGREAITKSLANEIGDSYNFYISRMLFGDGGTTAGTVKYVNSDRTGLFGITRANKPVIATIDPNLPSNVIFTTVLKYEEANGYALNEIALQMNNGDLYSMATFPDFGKTSSMQLTFSWRVSVI